MAELPSEQIDYGPIREEIQRMHKADQDMRKRAIGNRDIIENEEDDLLDKKHTDRMKEIVEKIGWPTISKFGQEVSNDAWLLVQHADHEVTFQKKCLELIRALPEGEVSPRNMAYLTDRICVNERRPQVYGTQFYEEGDFYGPRPIEDPEHVDERRQALGMEPLSEYEQTLRRIYNK